jgi:phospholipid/cholesterol/gamma-HCH transport system substrate-binding protein
MPDLERLLSSARVVMDTQNRHADDISTFSTGLKDIAEQFADSDADLRDVIDRGPQVGQQVVDVLETSGNDIGLLLANLLTTVNVAEPREASLEQLLVNFSVLGPFPRTVGGEEARGNLGLVFDNFDPPTCTKGYETTRQRPADDVREVEPNKQAYCAEPPGSPIAVRGAQNAPFAGEPVEVDPPEQDESSEDPGDELPGLLGVTGGQGEPGGMAGLLGGS